ncbi:single-stranded DNA-binding protein [Candidatus Sodalis sp. SoCistrobi]|uniref:single-stranded DNA-binding protein n=1 Tax=Candidatus Sodalis sp. SoCistrobi TaxID=1922216 RepID=UPI00093C85D3|nr:single-stranded DNA-binding protein [Candidatus Sodalis sp. SoCistrobi]
MSINVVIFSGNLGSDCVARSTPNGKVIATFSLPVKQGYGEHEKVTWVQCRMFGARAEKLPRYLTKGTKVTVTGQFVLESWTAKDGTEKSTPVVIVNEIDFTSKQEGQSQQNKPSVSNEAPPPFDDDIPF